ncbi:hypothetical protein KR009_003908, partial [Drosophila setifemur]
TNTLESKDIKEAKDKTTPAKKQSSKTEVSVEEGKREEDEEGIPLRKKDKPDDRKPKHQKCEDATTCGCLKLEAEAIKTNRQLLEFQVRSKDINWCQFIQPLDASVRSEAVYLDDEVDTISGQRRPVTEENRRELLVCHDMMGNYLEDRHFHSSEKYDDYRFVHWAAVDYFCYFSHGYVTIPPCGWLNAAHRHGVPTLGTFIVEAPGLLDEVLATQASVDLTVKALTRLCLHFGFEGWLVNVEVKVPQKNMPNLYYFVRELTSATEKEVPHGRVFWYDSVTENGELRWQNELNDRNVEFFRRSHATLINYAWDDSHLERSAQQAGQEQSPRHRVFMGLDVFGRSRKGGFQSLETMAKIAEHGFSAGIFAPGWAFETLNRFGYNLGNCQGDEEVNSAFLARNEAWWSRIWPTLGTHPNSKLPFFTDFCVGSGRASYERGFPLPDGRSFFNLSRQSLQPSVPLDKNAVHNFKAVYSGGCSLSVINYKSAFRLFATDFELTEGVLLVGYAYKIDKEEKEEQEATFDVLLRVTPLQGSNQEVILFCGNYKEPKMSPNRCYIPPLDEPLPPTKAHVELPQDAKSLGGGWQVRYHLVKFNGPVRVQDVGVQSKRLADSKSEAHLGAIYVSGFSLED